MSNMIMTGGQVPKIYVQVVDSTDVVGVNLNDLPQNPEDLLEILIAEAAPLSIWFDCARGYLAVGRQDAFDAIYETATAPDTAAEVEKFFGRKPDYEQIQFLCAKTFILMTKARDERSAEVKGKLLADARKLLVQAQGINANEQIVAVTSGLHHWIKGDKSQAELELIRSSRLKDNGQASVLGLVALAHVQYQQEKYKEALKNYRTALKEHPNCPAEVRLGMGATAFKLGDLSLARAAFKRAAELDGGCADALLGLALVHFSSPNVQQGVADGLKLLLEAYKLEPSHVGVLTQLAHYCLMASQPHKALQLAQAAMDGGLDSDSVRAELTVLRARAHHALGQMDAAQAEYIQAAKLDRRLALPRLGMAQMYCMQGSGSLRNALSELEEALKTAPNFTDALKILGHLLPAVTRDPNNASGVPGPATAAAREREAAVLGLLKDACARSPNDAELWETLGELQCESDPAASLAAYKRALDTHAAKQAAVVTEREAIKAKNEQAAAELQARLGRERAQCIAVTVKRRAQGTAAKAQPEGGLQGIDEEDGLFGSDSEEEGPAAAALEEFEAEAKAQEEALLREQEDPQAALSDHHTPAKLLNNAAVLYYRSGERAAAQSLLSRAAAAADREQRGEVPCTNADMISVAQGVTMAFNVARLAEASGDYKAAQARYEALLAQHPTYTDCLLRLACIARATGNHAEALKYAKAALECDQAAAAVTTGASTPRQRAAAAAAQADALALLSQLHMERREYDKANNYILELLQLAKNDTYGRIGYGNVQLYTAPSTRKTAEEERKAQERYSRALEEYSKVLAKERHNVWAANGVGAALAELGHLDAARSVFAEVHTAMAAAQGFLQVPDVIINLANVHLARQEYPDAIHLYKLALRELPHKHHPTVLLYLARAYYDSDNLLKGQAALARATHLAPTDYKLRFNFALTLQEWAVRTFKRKRLSGDPSKLDDFVKADKAINSAYRYFDHLKALGRERSGLDDLRLSKHVEFCEATIQSASQQLQAAQNEHNALELQRYELAKKREAAEFASQQDALRKAADAEAERRKREEAAEAAKAKLEIAKREWKMQRALLGEGDADGDANPDTVSGTAGGGGRKGRKGKGSKPKAKGPGAAGAAGVSDADAALDKLFGEDEEEEEEYEPGAEEAEDAEQEALRAAGLDSDGDGDAEEGGAAAGEDGEAAAAGTVASRRKRLRPASIRDHKAGQEAGVPPEGLEDEDEDAEEPAYEPGAEDEEELQDQGQDAPSARKRRRAALDEEEEGEGAGEQAGAAAGGQAEDAQYGDLFGDDEE